MSSNDILDEIIKNKNFAAIMPYIKKYRPQARDMKVLLGLAKESNDPSLKKQVKDCFNKGSFRKQNTNTK